MKTTFGRMEMIGVLGLVCLAFASGCGSSGGVGGGTAAGYKTKAQGGTGTECSDQLLQDAQTLGQNLQGASVDQAKTQVQAFGNKYKDVVCTYTDENGKTQTADINKMVAGWMAELNGGATAPQGHGGF